MPFFSNCTLNVLVAVVNAWNVTPNPVEPAVAGIVNTYPVVCRT